MEKKKSIYMVINFLIYFKYIEMSLIIEAIVSGLFTIIFGWIASFLVRPFFKVSLPEICKSWNKHRVMEVTLFVAGALGWIVAKKAFTLRSN